MIAITWNAFNHSYIGVSGRHSRLADLTPAHPFEHLLHMRDRGLRQDAVAEIEDERSLGKRLKDVIHSTIERGAAGKQRQWIEISLHRNAPLDLIAHEGEIGCPIQPHCIDGHVFDIAQKSSPDAAGKSNDPGTRYVTAHLPD